ncbi:zinc finger protein 638 isoform X1 [Anguilla anguilla]|uniref:zinc finger protein 638 isoform X1 n=1 Tax=Anguilla anguilla TaxID=7936 RepID=UPI0015AC9B00|nr:zinc finger protein 638 isoform X1 [Anguilla anguilla]
MLKGPNNVTTQQGVASTSTSTTTTTTTTTTSTTTPNTPNRFALFSESCVPVANSLNFGNFGSPLLFGPASLRLAQIKTQLALHQLNTITTGNHGATALSLLNLLKVTMSHPLYNPRGAPFSNQRPVMSNQYGLNAQPVLDMAGARLGPAAGMMSPMMPQQMGYQMAQHPTGLPQDMESTIDMHIRGAREEVRLLNQMIHQHKDPRLRKEPREEMLSQGNSFPPQRVPGRPEEQSTVDWSNYQNLNKLFAPQVMAQPSPPAQMFQPSGFGTPSGGGRGSAESQPPPASIPAERRQSRYTSESASSILASFGLSNEDLELLSHYPDEQLTPDNLPFILRDIRVRKAKRNLPDVDHRLPSPGTQDRLGGEPRPSKVIDYGHSSKFGYSEKSQDSFKHEQRTTDPQKYVRDAPVAVSTFPSVDSKRQSSGPVAKKPLIDQRKNPPSMEDKTGKSAPTRDSLPAPNRPTAGPPPPTHGIRANLVNLTEGSSALKPGFAVTKPAWSPSFPPSNAGTSKRLPTPTMMNDYSAASPRIFPHTCSLCNVECVQIKDWIEHQNTSIHIESCRRLRKQFPDWNVETVAVSRTERKPPLEHRPPKRRTRSSSRSRSWSRSPSPWRYHGRSDSRGRRPRSRSPRSRSPRRYRRSRSRSRSPRRATRPQAPLQPRRRSRTPPPRRSRTPPPRRSRSRSRSFTRLSPPRPTRWLNPRHASPRRQQQSSSSERLAKKLIESSGLAVTHNTTLEAMVESLAPALIAELAKKKSGSSSASTKSGEKKKTSPPTSGKTVPSKTGTSKNVKGKKGPAVTSCFLRLKGVPFIASHQEVMNVLQPYGKVNSATLYKKIEEATVCMEREEDAKTLAECRNLTIRGRTISICVEKDARDHKVKPLVGKKKEVPSAKLPASMKAKVPAKKTDGNVVKKVVKKDLPKKSIIQILGLPESGYTEDDLKNLATPFGFSSGLLIAVQQKQAFVELPDLDSAEAMLKTYKESPPKIQDCQLSFEHMTRPIDFSNPESLFRMLMGIEKPTEAANLGDRLLTVNNVPMGISPTTEVKELIKRFGSFKQALVLNHRIILEMDTPAIAKAVFNRFQKFPCIVQNSPLTFSVINKPVKAAEEVKKKPEVKSGRPAPKPGDAAKKGLAAPKTMAAGLKGTPAGPKTAAAAGKAKMSKAPATTPTPAATKAENPAAASAAATGKTAQPAPTVPPAVTPIATAAKEPPAKPNSPPPEGAVTSAKSQTVETTDNQKSQSDAPAGDQGTAEAPLVETKEDQGASQEALPRSTAPAPAEGDVANSAAVEDKDVMAVVEDKDVMAVVEDKDVMAVVEDSAVAVEDKEVAVKDKDVAVEGKDLTVAVEEKDVMAAEGDSKQDCKPAAVAKPESGPQAGKAPPAKGPAPTAPRPDQKPPDFPPVTQEILRALEAAVQECRMRSSLRRCEEAKRAEAGKGGAPPPRREPSPPRDRHRGRAQSDDELPPVTHRGSSSGSSSGSRKSRRDGSPAPRRGKDHEGEVDKLKNYSSSRSSKSSSNSKAAGDKRAEEQDFTEDIFPFDLDEFVTVDEVGDDVEGSSQEEEKKTSEPLQHSTPFPGSSRTRRRTRASPTAKNQKKPAPPTQKSLKKQTTTAKGKQAKKVPSKPVGTKDEQRPQVAAEGAGEVVLKMESETPKTEVEVDEKMEEQKVEEEKVKAPVSSDPQRGEDMEASTPESAAEVVETKTVDVAAEATTTTETVTLALESQPEHQAEEAGPAVEEKGQSTGETTVPSIPAAQKSQEPPVDRSPSEQCPAEESPAEAAPTERAPTETASTETAPVETDDLVPTKQEQPKKMEPGLKKAPQGLAAALVTLDEVSEEEEDYPDEEEDEEELLMEQNEALVTVDEVGGDEDPFLQAVKDLQALVTLDEIVEEDEPSSEPFPFGLGEETGDAFNPEALLTLDETQDDDEETGEEAAKMATSEKSTESPATHEALLTLDETLGDDEELEEDKIPSSEKSTDSPSLPTGLAQSDSPVVPSAESGELVGSPSPEEVGRGLEELRKMNFVTVDEVGEEEEQQQEEEEEEVEPAPSPVVRGGRPKKRGRQATVRKSARGRKPLPVKKEEADPTPVTPVEFCSVSVPDPQTVKTEASEDMPDDEPFHARQDPKSNGDKALSEDPQESLCTTNPRATVKEESRLRRDEGRLEEPDSKKHRTESPVPTDYKMPPFSANNPIGLEFVVPKTGFFCKLCSLFYGSEDAAKKTHCSSLKHYQNMEKHFQKLRAGSSCNSLSE